MVWILKYPLKVKSSKVIKIMQRCQFWHVAMLHSEYLNGCEQYAVLLWSWKEYVLMWSS